MTKEGQGKAERKSQEEQSRKISYGEGEKQRSNIRAGRERRKKNKEVKKLRRQNRKKIDKN